MAPPSTTSERTGGVRAMFSLPSVYRFAQDLIGATSFRQTLVDEVLAIGPGDRVLDIGCGTADILDHLPPVDYVGFDHSAEYIEDARRRYGDRGVFVTGTTDAEELIDVTDRDVVMAIGVLHHLDDSEARAALELAARTLRPGGRFVSIDPTFVPGQPRIARLLASRDRGQHVRTPEATTALVGAVMNRPIPTVRHDLLRIPYSHVICRASRR